MEDKKFYVLADLLSYNIRRSEELDQSEKDRLLKKVTNGSISIKDIGKYGTEPTGPIKEDYLTKKIEYNYDYDDDDGMQTEDYNDSNDDQEDESIDLDTLLDIMLYIVD